MALGRICRLTAGRPRGLLIIGSSAKTVSPAIARWPTFTSGSEPAGR